MPIESLKAMRNDSSEKEQEIFEGLIEATHAWDEQAGQTLLLDKAIEYVQMPPAQHSENQWIDEGQGHHLISNAVYQMHYRVYEQEHWDNKAKAQVSDAWYLTWSVSTNRPQGTRDIRIAGRTDIRYTDKDKMERYLDGRRRAYAHLFTELSPPVPKEYAQAFYVNGLLLGGYTVEGENPRQEGQAVEDKDVGDRRPTKQRKENTDMDNTATATTAAGAPTPIKLTADNPRDKLKEITDRLQEGIKGIFESGQYQTYLKTLSKFHRYSFNNCMLIALQKPDATHVAGRKSWRDNFKRNVTKDEKGNGIKILAPSPYKAKREREKIDPISGNTVTGKDGKPVTEEVEVTVPAFKVVSVFDVSQTEGEPLPEIGVDELTGDVEHYQDLYAALGKTSPVPIGFEDIAGEAKGYYSQAEGRIAIQEGMGELQTLKTAIHEIAHARLHDIDRNAPKDVARPDQETRETVAESIAYTVAQRYGLDTSEYSFGYIAGWSGTRELDVLKASLDTIRTEANAIITEADSHMAQLQKEREATWEKQPGYEQWSEVATADNTPDNPDVPSDDASAYLPRQDTFSIYQLQDISETRDHRFRSLQELQTAQLAVDAKNYKEAYAAPLKDGTTLENLYYTFNMDRPQDFTGHSLSVSDVVVLSRGGETTAYYVDNMGFQVLPGFVAQQQAQEAARAAAPDNPLKAAEMSTEQNLNMIDGVFNNTPTVAEIEARVKGGETISLTELAHAMKAERGSERKSADAPQEAEARRGRQPAAKRAAWSMAQSQRAWDYAQGKGTGASAQEKPSIREQLRQGKEQIAAQHSAALQKAAARPQDREV
jgi:hypothetical protein